MTNKCNSTYPQELIAQDSIQMQSELARKVTNVVEQKDVLFISVDGTKYTCKELIHIVHSYYKAVDTLRFYAGITQGELYEDQMHRARETLEEIENDRQS